MVKRYVLYGVAMAAILCAPRSAAVDISAPDEAGIDADIEVQISGDVHPRSFVTIVAPELGEGAYESYAYTRRSSIKLRTPADPGAYELRLLGPESPYPTLARRPIQLVMPQAELDAPASVPIGSSFDVRWRGPSGSNQYITLVPADTPEGEYADYAYARGADAGTVKLTTPTTPGAYELRYLTGSANRTLARRPLAVGDIASSVSAPASATIGSEIEVAWSGPGNPRDFITIVAPEAGPRDYADYVYTKASPVRLAVPDVPGRYELRYLSADSSRILAKAELQVVDADASLRAPARVEALSEFEVQWSGPGNALDYIAVTRVDRPKDYLTYSYTKRGNPLVLAAPLEPGEYQIHYLSGGSDRSLAKQSLRVEPGRASGRLQVVSAEGVGGQGAAPAVALVLDASGSMLQRLDGQRRIDLARAALLQLIEGGLPANAQVALRAFGHRKPDACDTELLAPLAPLNASALAAEVRRIEAKNLAKTPIADALAAVADDLAGVESQAIVVLVTDGEETCEGDPEAAIAGLRQQGFEVVLNVVGFAVDEHALEREFRRWAELGGGAYYSARDGAALTRGLREAVRRPFAVMQNERRVGAGFVGGEPIELPVGEYRLQIGGESRTIAISADQTTTVAER